jgi:hypothetical protein
MKRLRILVLSLLVASGLAATSAFAAAPTFHQGPSFTDQGGGFTVNLFAEASGLGNADLTGTIDFSGTVQYTCQNKGGATAPGQPLQIDQQASQSARANPKNGRATIDLTASFTPPATVPGDEIGCPNGNWRGINPVVIGPVSATGTITWKGEQLFQQTISPVTP